MNTHMSLDQLPTLAMAKVTGVIIASPHEQTARQLEDVGFVPGEQVQILKRAWLGADPMVVRVGLSTFALRQSEAQLIEIEPTP